MIYVRQFFALRFSCPPEYRSPERRSTMVIGHRTRRPICSLYAGSHAGLKELAA